MGSMEVTGIIQGRVELPGVCGFRYAGDTCPLSSVGMCACWCRRGRAYLAEAIRDGLRLEAIAADIAGDGHAASRC